MKTTIAAITVGLTWLMAANRTNAASVTLNFLNQATLASSTMYGGTTVGGLSGITYDPISGNYYTISDSRNSNGLDRVRFYTLTIGNLSGGGNLAVNFTGVTTLKDSGGSAFAPNTSDTEGIALTRGGNVFISSEGVFSGSQPVAQPFVNRFSLATGQQNLALPIPNKFTASSGNTGIRDNRAFESLTITPDQQFLFTATENALKQDGAASTASAGSPSRILRYNLSTGLPDGEFLYNTDAGNGLSELLALDNNTFLAIDRTVTPPSGSLRLYEVSLQGATNIQGISSLTAFGGIVTPVQKTLIADFATTSGFPPGNNFEGMTFGPNLPNGNRSLILISDNNFGSVPPPFNSTQIAAFEVRQATAVPYEFSPTLGILALGAWGTVAKMKKKKQ